MPLPTDDQITVVAFQWPALATAARECLAALAESDDATRAELLADAKAGGEVYALARLSDLIRDTAALATWAGLRREREALAALAMHARQLTRDLDKRPDVGRFNELLDAADNAVWLLTKGLPRPYAPPVAATSHKEGHPGPDAPPADDPRKGEVYAAWAAVPRVTLKILGRRFHVSDDRISQIVREYGEPRGLPWRRNRG
jgi:hypothetical protein